MSIYTQRMVLRFVSIIHRHLLKCFFFFFAKTLEFSFYYNVRVFPVYKNRPFVTHSYRFLFLNLAEIFIFKITIFFCSWENKFCLWPIQKINWVYSVWESLRLFLKPGANSQYLFSHRGCEFGVDSLCVVWGEDQWDDRPFSVSGERQWTQRGQQQCLSYPVVPHQL